MFSNTPISATLHGENQRPKGYTYWPQEMDEIPPTEIPFAELEEYGQLSETTAGIMLAQFVSELLRGGFQTRLSDVDLDVALQAYNRPDLRVFSVYDAQKKVMEALSKNFVHLDPVATRARSMPSVYRTAFLRFSIFSERYRDHPNPVQIWTPGLLLCLSRTSNCVCSLNFSGMLQVRFNKWHADRDSTPR